jgi:hypothetical protein
MRRIAGFLFWLGLFGLFLAFAAYSVGAFRWDLTVGSSILLGFSWLVLRKPRRDFRPDRRFRTLRRLGLIDRSSNKEEN